MVNAVYQPGVVFAVPVGALLHFLILHGAVGHARGIGGDSDKFLGLLQSPGKGAILPERGMFTAVTVSSHFHESDPSRTVNLTKNSISDQISNYLRPKFDPLLLGDED